jgi:predicted transcriptional regulator
MENKAPIPTEGEMEILRVLWARGPSTVRQVHAGLGKETGYTTVLKLMQIMSEKGLVERDVSSHAHVYTTKASEEQTQRRVMGRMLDKVFGGSAQKLVLAALSAKKASPEELDEIRKLIEDHKQRGGR